MSFKRIPQINRKGRGRIKYDYDVLNKLRFDKGTNCDSMCTKTIEHVNKDAIQSPRNEETTNEMEVSISSNFPLPAQTEMTHEIESVNVEEWFKQRTESVSGIDLDSECKNEGMEQTYLSDGLSNNFLFSKEILKSGQRNESSIDLDSVIKNEGIDTAYLNEGINNHFLLNKDVDMTCIVTNICDIGLGLCIPSHDTGRSKNKLITDSFIEKDCDNAVLSNYSTAQDSLLNDLDRNDILDKNILAENVEINKHKAAGKSEKQSGQVRSDDQFATIEISSGGNDNKVFKTHLWHSADIQTSIGHRKDASNWENLSTNSKQSVEADSEREIDFPELNLITFPIDTNDTICNINQNSQIESSDKELVLQSATTNVNNKFSHSQESNITTPLVNISTETQNGILPENDCEENSTGISNPVTEVSIPKCPLVPTLNPRSLLKTQFKTAIKHSESTKTAESSCSTQTKIHDLLGGQPVESTENASKKYIKKTPSMAIIAISTDKSKNLTEIVINTPYGEQVFKGRTSDLMKATSGLWQKLDNNKTQKVDQPLTISMMDGPTGQTALPSSTGDQPNIIPMQTDISTIHVAEDVEESNEPPTEEDEPVMEALAELGIAVDRDNIFCLTTGAGQKLLLCPIKDCGKMYQRQSMLKIHILSHFNVRPFRCNFQGCHWSFYTYFKLKRHKETHLKRKDFVCPMQGCERRFTTIYNLNTHQKLHDRPLEMICPVEMCVARFQTKRSLELHMKTHEEHHAPYKCSYEGCGKHYYSLNSLNSHSRSHQHKEEEVRCQWEGCGKIFDKPCRLRCHMRSHTGDKPYLCTFKDCGWAFPSASKLKRHQNKHTNERKFKCEIEGCGKSFMRPEHLKEHTLTHDGQRNFQCPIESCGVKFSAKSSLYVHLKKHNKNECESNDKVVYHCPIEKCIRTYTCKSSLRQHMLKFHTPVLANDPSQLDYIALLTGDEELGTLEGLQFSGDMLTTGNLNSLNAVSLVTPSSMLISSNEGMGCIPPDYINADFHLPGILPSTAGNNIIGYSNTSTSNVITHVVLTPENHSSLMVAGPSISTAETVETGQTDIGVSTDQTLSMPIFEPDTIDIDSNTACVFGSARTSYTYQDVVRERDRRKGNRSPSSTETSSVGMRLPTDVVLGTGLLGSNHDIAQSLLLQDDLQTSHTSLYPEDHMMAVGPGIGEFQVLLLDPINNTRHEFAESTINLRDLE